MKKSILSLTMVLLSLTAFAQHTVVGKVTDCKGNQLAGVIVALAESIKPAQTTGSITDQDGNYTISAPKDGTLLFQYVGMETKTVKIEGRKQIDVVFDQEAQDKTLYVVDGRVVSKADFDKIESGEIKNINVVKGISKAVVVSTKGVCADNKPVDPKTVSVISIKKEGENVVIDEKLNGTMIRVVDNGKNNNNNFDALIVVKAADGTVKRGENISAFSPNQIKSIAVYKEGSTQAQTFNHLGDTSKGVIFIELK